MTCPSPATFQTDKGEFKPGETSVYPPRNDLTNFDDPGDGPDPITYAELNELDMISRATPIAGPVFVRAPHPSRRRARGPLVAWIEVSLEWDENADWDFDREDDHLVDPRRWRSTDANSSASRPSCIASSSIPPCPATPRSPSTRATPTGTARPGPCIRPTRPSPPPAAAEPIVCASTISSASPRASASTTTAGTTCPAMATGTPRARATPMAVARPSTCPRSKT